MLLNQGQLFETPEELEFSKPYERYDKVFFYVIKFLPFSWLDKSGLPINMKIMGLNVSCLSPDFVT